jgi:hypothetical protein
MVRHTSAEVFPMPISDLQAAAFGLGNAMQKEKKQQAVSKYTFIPLLLFIGAYPALASPVSYTIDGTVSSTHGVSASLTGSFTYDSSITDSFSFFTTDWDGFNFDLTDSANNPTLGAASTCIGGSTGPAATFAFLNCGYAGAWFADEDLTTSLPFAVLIGRDTSGGANTATVQDGTLPGASNIADSGDLSIAQTAPEPGTTALLLIGLGLVMRKRIVTSKPRT